MNPSCPAHQFYQSMTILYSELAVHEQLAVELKDTENLVNFCIEFEKVNLNHTHLLEYFKPLQHKITLIHDFARYWQLDTTKPPDINTELKTMAWEVNRLCQLSVDLKRKQAEEKLRSFEAVFHEVTKELSLSLHPTEENWSALKPQLSDIVKLKISKALYSLPPHFSDLKNLQELDLSNNHFTFVPKEVMSLQNLRVLNLANNTIKALKVPRDLVELDLRNNPLAHDAHIPWTIPRLHLPEGFSKL